MDSIHAELDLLLGRCVDGPQDWVGLLSEIDTHLRHHFQAEDRWMEETDFPARECHVDEHAAVLKSSGEVLDLAREGRFEHAPSFIEHLSNWFPGHADYLDSALAAWMCKQQYGGKPIVVHRRSRDGVATKSDRSSKSR
jgi:hemerythrin